MNALALLFSDWVQIVAMTSYESSDSLSSVSEINSVLI